MIYLFLYKTNVPYRSTQRRELTRAYVVQCEDWRRLQHCEKRRVDSFSSDLEIPNDIKIFHVTVILSKNSRK